MYTSCVQDFYFLKFSRENQYSSVKKYEYDCIFAVFIVIFFLFAKSEKLFKSE